MASQDDTFQALGDDIMSMLPDDPLPGDLGSDGLWASLPSDATAHMELDDVLGVPVEDATAISPASLQLHQPNPSHQTYIQQQQPMEQSNQMSMVMSGMNDPNQQVIMQGPVLVPTQAPGQLSTPMLVVNQPQEPVQMMINPATAQASTPNPTPTVAPPATAKKTRKKKDPNAPAAVSSAYAFFFKDTQANIKAHNPGAKFGEVSKIVASLWEGLEESKKAEYRKKNEEDKLRFEREMAEYKARQEGAAVAAPAELNTSSSGLEFIPNGGTVLEGGTLCIRLGCSNPAISNPEWEDEYCSNECVVRHCKNVFSKWIASH